MIHLDTIYSIQTLDHYYLKLILINAVINAKEKRYPNKFKSFRFCNEARLVTFLLLFIIIMISGLSCT